jgi:hypothetical protein
MSNDDEQATTKVTTTMSVSTNKQAKARTKTTKTKTTYLMCGVLLALALGIPAGYFAGRARAAGIPATQALTYSGVLTDATGAPLTGTMPVQIALFDAATAGNQLCVTLSVPQTLIAGAFQMVLPDTCTTVVRGNPNLWVEILVSGLAIGRTKLAATPYAVVAAETSCGPTSGPAMVDTGAGFCIDTADRGTETAYASAVNSCAIEGKVVCSFVQLCTARIRSVGALGAAPYRVSDLMFFTGDTGHYFGAGTGGNALVLPAACAGLTAPGPQAGTANFRCCRGKG